MGTNMSLSHTDKKYHLDRFHVSEPIVCREALLYQAGRLFCSANTEVPTHVHLDWLELTVVTGGRGTVITNGVPAEVETGDIYLSFPADPHAITPDREDPLRYDFLSYMPTDETLSGAVRELMLRRASPDCRVFHSERTAALVKAAIAETDSNEPYANEMLDAILREITICLLRAFEGAAADTRMPTEAEELCYRVMNYVDTHLYSLKNLTELGELTRYNYCYLSHLFHKTSGITVAEYYRRRRMETARLLVREGELTLSRIAVLLSYSSVYAFSKAYKAYFHCAPRADAG